MEDTAIANRASLISALGSAPGVIIPLISRPRVRGINAKLTTQLTGWDLDLSGLHNWFREA